MAKTVANLITEARSLSDEEFDTAQWLAWMNAGLDDLAPILYMDKKVTLSPVNGVFPMPADYLSTIKVTGDDGALTLLPLNDETSAGYRPIDGNIELQDDDSATITLWYYYSPEHFTTLGVNQPIDTRLEAVSRAIVFYACAMGMLREDEAERYSGFMDQYSGAKSMLAAQNSNRRPGRIGQWAVIR